jgi:hypothetical protein
MLNLYAQYYVPKNKKRQLEIDTCFQKNIENIDSKNAGLFRILQG